MVRNTDFDTGVPLPPGLTVQALSRAIEYVERELADLIDIYFEQANVFSALVGMYGTKALDSFSVYEKSKHTDIAQQRFPDLKRRGSPDPPPPEQSLKHITTIPAGISFGATWSTPRCRSNRTAHSSSGESTSHS